MGFWDIGRGVTNYRAWGMTGLYMGYEGGHRVSRCGYIWTEEIWLEVWLGLEMHESRSSFPFMLCRCWWSLWHWLGVQSGRYVNLYHLPCLWYPLQALLLWHPLALLMFQLCGISHYPLFKILITNECRVTTSFLKLDQENNQHSSCNLSHSTFHLQDL